ncbi:MAG: hypothetical protein C6I01_00940 [Epsilonproteobacteria bacterium]|jgi:hypothetical protein|nr:hypothetical protein [Campylobacterota bacterium]NPA89364.1 glycoside hydrolase family 5 protein [Campylobacterota bacterium]
MKKIVSVLAVAGVLAFGIQEVTSVGKPKFRQAFPKGAPITPAQYQRMLGLGIDVNWANFKWVIGVKGYRDAPAFRRIGFDTIRIRFKDPRKLGMDEKSYFRYLKKCVKATLRSGMVPVLAFVAKDFHDHPTPENMARALEVWKKVAHKFKNFPYKLSYDLMLEPGKGINRHQEMLNEYYQKAIQEIRKVDKRRIVMVAPRHASNPYYLKDLVIPKDPYLMVEWHYFAAGPNPRKPESEIYDKPKYAYQWLQEHHLKGWVGAVMPGNYNHGDTYTIEQQKEFMGKVIDALKTYHFPMAINADTQFYDYRHHRFGEKRLPVLKFIVKKWHTPRVVVLQNQNRQQTSNPDTQE